MVTVSIVTYHTSTDELERCLASLTSSVVDTIYIVDNGEETRLADWAAGKPNVVYLTAPNPGYGAAHNIAIRKAMARGTDYHLVLNSDVRFSPDVLDRLAEYMDAHPDVGQVQPDVTYPDGKRQYTCRLLPTPFDVFGRRFLPKSWFRGRDERYTLKKLDRTVEQNIPYHQGSFMFLRSNALQEVGLFDERFFMYPEDIDLTRRIHRVYKTVYYPFLKIVHDHRAASYHSLRMTVIHATNMIRYFNKWGWWHDVERRRYNAHLIAQLKKAKEY